MGKETATATVYHSTDAHGLKGIRACERLFGGEIIDPHPGFSGDGNLTTDKKASTGPWENRRDNNCVVRQRYDHAGH